MERKKLLFPTDFTEHSAAALKEAVRLNLTLNYELVIFHTYSRPYSKKELTTYHQSVVLKSHEESIDLKFEQLVINIPELKDHVFHFRKKLGSSTDMIIEQLNDEPSDLIVMSTKGAVGIGEMWGTKTAKIIKSVNIPVLVIPVNTKLTDFKRIGLACDYSEDIAYDKLEFLVTLAEKGNLEIDIVTLNRNEKTMISHEIANRENVLKLLRNVPTKISFTNHSDINIGLIEYCKSHDIGLISVLPKSYNFIERIFHESLTVRMAFQSPIPLLVLK